jgi:hypothetical protein
MNATVTLDKFNRLPVSRALRAMAGFKRKQPLRAVAMPGKIIIEAMPAGGRLGRRKGRMVWTGELPEGVNSANAVNALRNAGQSLGDV